MPNLSELIAQNAQRWRIAKSTRDFSATVKRLVQAKARYQSVTRMTGVPWFVVAVIHQRESSQSWAESLAQGDPWDQVSTHVPKSRGPFDSWEAAAVDTLVGCPPHAATWKDWSAGGALTLLEQFNGLGYFKHGIPSPYIWSGTDQYKSGKYVADHDFCADVVDVQLGCAGLLLAMRALDPTIRFADEATPPPNVEPVQPKPKVAPHVAVGSVVAAGMAAATQATSVAEIVPILCAVVAIGIGIYWFTYRS